MFGGDLGMWGGVGRRGLEDGGLGRWSRWGRGGVRVYVGSGGGVCVRKWIIRVPCVCLCV